MSQNERELGTFVPEESAAECYRTGELLAEGKGFTIQRGWETSLDAPCFIHRMNHEGEPLTPRQAHAAANLLKRFGALNQPRTPRLADAWIEETDVVAVEYRPNAEVFDLENSNPFLRGGKYSPAAIIEGSLTTLSALHYCGIIHGQLLYNCWGMAEGGRVYLVDTSLDVTIVNCLKEMALDANPTLSTNLFTRDVACWAYAMISLMQGRDLVPESLDEKWDDYFHKQAEKGLVAAVKREPAREFLRACLAGFGPMPSVFDTGLEALRAFRNNHIREAFE